MVFNITGCAVIELFDGNEALILKVNLDRGAAIIELNLPTEKGKVPLFWPIEDEEILSNPYGKQDILFPFPNRLENGEYTFEGKTYKMPINDAEYHNAIHGFVRERPFRIVKKTSNSESAELQLMQHFEGNASFPFSFDFYLCYTLIHGEFKVSFEVVNTGFDAMPFGLGWHPYFLLTDKSARLKLPAVTQFEMTDRMLPSGRSKHLEQSSLVHDNSYYDASFKLRTKEVIYELKQRSVVLNIIPSPEFGYLQVYSPTGKDVWAIEPMSCSVNALNTKDGLLTLPPKAVFKASITIQIMNYN